MRTSVECKYPPRKRRRAVLAAALRAIADVVESDDEEPSAPASTAWMHAAESPKGKRWALERARCGDIVSTKVGKTVLLDRQSHDAYLASHTRTRPVEAPVAELAPEDRIRAELGLVAVSGRRRSA